MSSYYLSEDFDEIFENDTNDLNNELINDDSLPWNCDLLNLNSNEFNFDPLLDDSVCDTILDRSKMKMCDIETSLTDFNDLLKEEPVFQHIKLESNSVSSTYLTDESSDPSSTNSSPVLTKVRKRDHTTMDSTSEQDIIQLPKKTTKYELINSSQPTAKIYKLSKDVKTEPIYINTLTIRHQGANNPPYVVHKLPGGVKTVNIFPQKVVTEKSQDTTNNRFIYSPQRSISDQDQDSQSVDFQESKIDHYKSRPTGYFHSVYGSAMSESQSNRSVFQPIPQAGSLYLTEEEKRTLLAEGYSIPTRLPLSKQDERNLKKVRRKIKNKISAQESRRKKKEYLESLEKKMDCYEHERVEFKRRIQMLENSERSLYSQLRHLQQQVMNKVTGPGNTTSTGLMLFMVCFALLLVGGSLPSSYRQMNLPQTRLISSSSLYYMGYGMSKNLFNYSEQAALFRESSQYNLEKMYPQALEERRIRPRQSILLGDENDEKKFEELILSYVKKKQVCQLELNQKILGNNDTVGEGVLLSGDPYHEASVAHVLANILLVK